MKARGATLIQWVVRDYNSIVCRTATTETCNVLQVCQQQLLQGVTAHSQINYKK